MEIDNPIYEKDNRELLNLVYSFDCKEGEEGDMSKINEAYHTLPMDFEQGRSVAEIPQIRRLPPLRDDGYSDTMQEKRRIEERPWNKSYYDDYLQRQRILDEDPNSRFIEILSGLMDEEVTDLYVAQDLEQKAHERAERELRMRLEAKRSIISLDEKEKELGKAEKERTIMEDDVISVDRLTEKESSYIEDIASIFDKREDNNQVRYGIIPLIIIGYNLSLYIEEKSFNDLKSIDVDVTSLSDLTTNEDKEEFRETIKINNIKREEFLLQANKMLMLYHYLINTNSSVYIDTVIQYTDKEGNGGNVKKSSGSEIDWSKILGSVPKEVAINYTQASIIFGDSLDSLLLSGCTYKIGKNDSFNDMLQLYLTAKVTIDELKTSLPTKLSKLKEMDNDQLRAYFLNAYFKNASRERLAIDSPKIKLTETKKLCGTKRKEVNQVIDARKGKVIASVKEMVARINKEEQLFKRILNTPVKLGGDNFDTINESLSRVSPMRWIRDEQFKTFVATGERLDGIVVSQPSTEDYVPGYVTQHFPVILVYQIYASLVKYALKGSTLKAELIDLNKVISTLKLQISRIRMETHSMHESSGIRPDNYRQTQHFTALPMNSGIIKLQSYVRSGMEIAYLRVKKYCPRLNQMPYSGFQSDDALKSGLLLDYARYVASVIATVRLTFPKQYKSLHLSELTIRGDAEALHALKNYKCKRTRLGFVTEYSPIKLGDSGPNNRGLLSWVK
jgi:hypothetical protein